ncbi:DNA polymerase III subunit [Adhaeribacter radiodurans]|uniref:DNA polymerase III subunit delta n=1 Tax=Adhaeribacter radiodurans TaxID=2745197 RepID=A0A7L7L309_9BACT|nr:DNA polymerase III subunit delta [Adhaeribacter radiodurans]QMU27187.1 DNA polymerase III subunit delta [Adhaeribacter radiodurans]
MFFSEIEGHDETKQLLVNSVQNQHVAHAQLFVGPGGSASLALALAYATYLNCENKQPTDACGTCASCSKINKLIHPDVNFVMPVTTTKSQPKDVLSQKFLTEWREFVLTNPYQTLNDWMQFIGAENKQGNISKDESRQLVKFASLKAFEATFKIILIWLPELMHPAAANALLKLLEEPPANTIFLLVANSADKLLATILSRTQMVKVRAFTDEEIITYLTRKGLADESKAQQITLLAEGNLQVAMQLSTEMTNDYFDFFVKWMRHCYANKFGDVVELSEDFQKMGRENQKNFLHYALSSLRKVLLYGINPELISFIPPTESDFIQRFSKIVREANAPLLTEELNQAHYHIERNANPKMVFIDSSIQIARYLKLQN